MSFSSVCPKEHVLWGGHCMKYISNDGETEMFFNESKPNIHSIDDDVYAGLVLGQALLDPKETPVLAYQPDSPTSNYTCWNSEFQIQECQNGSLYISRNGKLLIAMRLFKLDEISCSALSCWFNNIEWKMLLVT